MTGGFPFALTSTRSSPRPAAAASAADSAISCKEERAPLTVSDKILCLDSSTIPQHTPAKQCCTPHRCLSGQQLYSTTAAASVLLLNKSLHMACKHVGILTTSDQKGLYQFVSSYQCAATHLLGAIWHDDHHNRCCDLCVAALLRLLDVRFRLAGCSRPLAFWHRPAEGTCTTANSKQLVAGFCS